MTEQPTTREIQMTLTEFNAERGGSMADAAEARIAEETSEQQFQVFVELASVIEDQLYDGRPNHENIASHVVTRLELFGMGRDVATALSERYLARYAPSPLVWHCRETGEIVNPPVMDEGLHHGLGGHTFVKHADGSVRELSSFGNEMAVFHLVHESHIESGGPEGYEPTAS